MSSRKTYLTANVDDGEPTDKQQRKEYVAAVSGFFFSHMNPKLNAMLVDQHNALANPMNEPKEDYILKGAINGIALIQDWGDAMLSEHLHNIENPDEDPEEPEDTP